MVKKIGCFNKHKILLVDTKYELREKALLYINKKSKAIILYNLDNTIFGVYSSTIHTALSINCNEKTRIKALKLIRKCK